ncbi:MAG: signal peptide peptidase SppA [Chlorobiaceae bacterium]|nr:signal peptide peptidase SppA [Chlorobiaceae bacterium]
MTSEPKKKRGCLRTGCLTVLALPIVLVVIAWAMNSWSHRLPGSFVLRLPVTGQIDERPADPVSVPFSSGKQPLSLQELLTVMERAGGDARVRSVLLDIDGVSAPPAKIEELRHAIEGLRRSGKRVTAFLHTPEDKDYLLAVACDTVIVQKGSWLLLDGLKAESFYFAEPLGKLGIGFQASQWKKYKSAIEPLTRSGSSPENREELGQLLQNSWDDYLGYVSSRRGIDRAVFAGIIDSVAVLSPEQALSRKLVDRVSSAWQLEKGYERTTGVKAPDLFVGGHEYLQATGGMEVTGKDGRIAVINVVGPIVSAGGVEEMADGEGIDEATLKQALEIALEDREVKAIVLRIDSPGGDALAASSMLEMLEAARKKKPIVASMSGVAASGGYMVALGTDRIYADPLTLTGSIGVFALKPDFSGLLQKAGIKREVLVRGRFADAYTPFKPFDQEAFSKFDETSGEIYRDFVGKVAARRKMTFEQVDAVAGGRVWTGRNALDVGLVDKLGGFGDAVKAAQELAHMDKSRKPGLIFLPAARSWSDYLFGNDSSVTLPGVASRIAALHLFRALPFSQDLPLQGAARMLLRSDSPRILALDPVEVVIK